MKDNTSWFPKPNALVAKKKGPKGGPRKLAVSASGALTVEQTRRLAASKRSDLSGAGSNTDGRDYESTPCIPDPLQGLCAPQDSRDEDVPPLNIARQPTERTVRSACHPAQSRFHDRIRARIDSQVSMKGHGSKNNEQNGRYSEKSMWFLSDDPVLEVVPGLDVYYEQPVRLVCWEYMQPQIGVPPCPKCRSAKRVSRNGWDKQSRLVYGEHHNYYLIGFQYGCQECSHIFAPWHPDVVSQLPRELQESLPCVIFPRSAIDIRLMRQIEKLLVKGIGFKAIEDMIIENHKDTYMDRQSLFLFGIANRRNLLEQGRLMTFNRDALYHPPQFSTFSDSEGYNGRTPSDTLLQSAWHEWFKLKEYFLHRQAQLIDGEVLCGDASYKFVSVTFDDYAGSMFLYHRPTLIHDKS